MRTRNRDRRQKPVHHEPFVGRRSALGSLGYDLRFAAGVLTDTVLLR
jgi:hypothetical protein